MKKIKILTVTPSLKVCGGIESYCMNYYRNLDDRFSMDFVTHDTPDDILLDELTDNGSRVSVLPPFSLSKLPETLGILRKFFINRRGYYDILHCNMANASCFYFPYAKKADISVRILHSHQNRAADKTTHAIRNTPLLIAGEKMATHRLACSRLAGDFLFPHGNYTVIPNAIDTQRYIFDSEKRMSFRKKYNLHDSFVIGTIGRLTEQKNHKKLLDIMAVLIRKNKLNCHLVIVGEGHLYGSLIKQAKALKISDHITMTGALSDVTYALCGMDVFVLPSLYEGLGIVNIEAAASGLPVVVSDGVPDDADMGGSYKKIPLSHSNSEWASEIAKISPAKTQERSDIKNIIRIRERGYDIKFESAKLADYYCDSLS